MHVLAGQDDAKVLEQKRTRQQALRDYLDEQVRCKHSDKEIKQAHAAAYAQAQQAQVDAWKAAEESAEQRRKEQQLQYASQLRLQVAGDLERKTQVLLSQRQGTLYPTSISTNRDGGFVNTIRNVKGRMVPYVLEESCVLSTLGGSVKFDIVSADDGLPIHTRSRKSSRYFIE